MPKRSWLVDPIGHRWTAASGRPKEMEFFGQMVPVISPAMPPLDEWICDMCNGEITIRQKPEEPFQVRKPCWIPMIGSYALCLDCMVEEMPAEDAPEARRKLAAGTFAVADWSMNICACVPCTTMFYKAIATMGRSDGEG